MTISISHQTFWDLFVVEETPPSNPLAEFETYWKCPTQLGEGYIRKIQLRHGLSLLLWDYQLHDELIVEVPERNCEDCLEFGFSISGYFQDKYHLLTAGDNYIFGSGKSYEEVWYWAAVPRVVYVSLLIAPEVFSSFFDNKTHSFSTELQQLVRKADCECFVRKAKTSSAMQVALQQLLQCPYTNLTGQMYLEAKMLELISLLLEQMLESQGRQADPYPLHPDNLDRIHRVTEILEQSFVHPPSLIELARQVGLNDCTLKRGFRQIYGTTVFGYLHNYRLEQARQLLDAGYMNVTEVAKKVGFSDRSYFAAAFRKKFGKTPRAYLKERRGKLITS